MFFLNLVDITYQQSCNFTHRSAFGTLGAGDIQGEFKTVGSDFLFDLKNTFSNVFSDPIYPV